MTDNEQIKLFKPLIESGLLNQGITAIVQSAYQPTQQGTPNGITVFFSKVGGDVMLGTPHRVSDYNITSGTGTDTETQRIESTWQIGALSRQVPTVDSYTSSDIINIVQIILSSLQATAIFAAAGVGSYRVSNIRNPYFKDDRDQYQASPNFDFTIVHNRAIILSNNNINTFDFTLERI